jgi:hypothetical protein
MQIRVHLTLKLTLDRDYQITRLLHNFTLVAHRLASATLCAKCVAVRSGFIPESVKRFLHRSRRSVVQGLDGHRLGTTPIPVGIGQAWSCPWI